MSFNYEIGYAAGLKRKNPYTMVVRKAPVKRRRALSLRGPAADRIRSQARANRALRARNQSNRGFLGIETKFYDTALIGGGIPAPVDCAGAEFDPSATSMISTPVVGDGEQNRDGKKIAILSAQITGVVTEPNQANQTNLDVPNVVVCYLVLDTQSNGAQLNSEDVFKNTGADATLNGSLQRNLLFANRFRVLKKWKSNMGQISATYDGTNIEVAGMRKTFDWFVKFPGGLAVNFNAGTTASIANVIDNSLHIIAFTTGGAGTPLLSYNARIRFQG